MSTSEGALPKALNAAALNSMALAFANAVTSLPSKRFLGESGRFLRLHLHFLALSLARALAGSGPSLLGPVFRLVVAAFLPFLGDFLAFVIAPMSKIAR